MLAAAASAAGSGSSRGGATAAAAMAAPAPTGQAVSATGQPAWKWLVGLTQRCSQEDRRPGPRLDGLHNLSTVVQQRLPLAAHRLCDRHRPAERPGQQRFAMHLLLTKLAVCTGGAPSRDGHVSGSLYRTPLIPAALLELYINIQD
jgi:hypothetical protein